MLLTEISLLCLNVAFLFFGFKQLRQEGEDVSSSSDNSDSDSNDDDEGMPDRMQCHTS